MSRRRFERPRSRGRQPRVIRNCKGLPARRIPSHRVGRCFGQLQYTVRRSGVCVITDKGQPALMAVRIDLVPALAALWIELTAAEARRRDLGGVFSTADQVFGLATLTDRWMADENWSLGNRRPVDQLGSDEGSRQVLNILSCIAHGISPEPSECRAMCCSCRSRKRNKCGSSPVGRRNRPNDG